MAPHNTQPKFQPLSDDEDDNGNQVAASQANTRPQRAKAAPLAWEEYKKKPSSKKPASKKPASKKPASKKPAPKKGPHFLGLKPEVVLSKRPGALMYKAADIADDDDNDSHSSGKEFEVSIFGRKHNGRSSGKAQGSKSVKGKSRRDQEEEDEEFEEEEDEDSDGVEGRRSDEDEEHEKTSDEDELEKLESNPKKLEALISNEVPRWQDGDFQFDMDFDEQDNDESASWLTASKTRQQDRDSANPPEVPHSRRNSHRRSPSALDPPASQPRPSASQNHSRGSLPPVHESQRHNHGHRRTLSQPSGHSQRSRTPQPQPSRSQHLTRDRPSSNDTPARRSNSVVSYASPPHSLRERQSDNKRIHRRGESRITEAEEDEEEAVEDQDQDQEGGGHRESTHSELFRLSKKPRTSSSPPSRQGQGREQSGVDDGESDSGRIAGLGSSARVYGRSGRDAAPERERTSGNGASGGSVRKHSQGKSSSRSNAARANSSNADSLPAAARNKRRRDPERDSEPERDSDREQANRDNRSTRNTRRQARPPSKRSRVEQSESEDSEVDDEDIDQQDDRIELVIPSSGRLQLTRQYPRVQQVASGAIARLLLTICTKNAFPDGPEKTADVARRALLKSAEAFKYKKVVAKIKNDPQYSRRLSTIPVQRISNLRGRVKKATDNIVETFYDVEPGDVEKVQWLHEGLRYIYPHNYEDNTVDGTAAYSPTIFLKVLRNTFFNKSKSLGYVASEFFKSSLSTEPNKIEIPAPMLALVATAVHASIEDCRTVRAEVGEFRANLFLDTYQSHMDVLTEIKEDNLEAYHKLMHNLFTRVSGGSSGVSSVRRAAKSFLNAKEMAK